MNNDLIVNTIVFRELGMQTIRLEMASSKFTAPLRSLIWFVIKCEFGEKDNFWNNLFILKKTSTFTDAILQDANIHVFSNFVKKNKMRNIECNFLNNLLIISIIKIIDFANWYLSVVLKRNGKYTFVVYLRCKCLCRELGTSGFCAVSIGSSAFSACCFWSLLDSFQHRRRLMNDDVYHVYGSPIIWVKHPTRLNPPR